ncbi:MAG: DNA gyrase inhibitor YacG [Candidatus Rokuibacteriota bacterium]|nr:MAG: DNA gyrase inhibitor YacG [Candidatus Rokubacteria bacterium]
MPHVTCPTCSAPTPWQGNTHRPFCSLSCRLIDLGGWLDERYRVPAETPDEPPPPDDDDVS